MRASLFVCANYLNEELLSRFTAASTMSAEKKSEDYWGKLLETLELSTSAGYCNLRDALRALPEDVQKRLINEHRETTRAYIKQGPQNAYFGYVRFKTRKEFEINAATNALERIQMCAFVGTGTAESPLKARPDILNPPKEPE